MAPGLAAAGATPGFTPGAWLSFDAISSRAMSDVVEMPETLSLKSSTFEAQRSASSRVTSFCE